MNTVEIPLKISGLAEIKAELRALKGELANATDPKEMAELAEKAGELSDKLKDANEKSAAFATGSKFEAVSNSFGLIKNDLASLDFEGAKEKAKIFATTLGKINPSEIGKAFKDFTGMITTLGGAFIKLGATILMNPIFLIVAAITAIVVGIGLLLNKFGLLDDVIDALMAPINAVIQALKDLADWIGITNFAEEDAENKRQENHKKQMERYEQEKLMIDQSRDAKAVAQSNLEKGFDRQMALAQAEGKETTELQRKKIEASIQYQKELLKEIDLLLQRKIAEVQEQERTMGGQHFVETQKQMEDLRRQQSDAYNAIAQGENDLKILKLNNAKKEKEAAAEAAKKAADNAKKRAEEAAKRAKEELDNRRKLRDFELSQIKDDAQREEAITREKYARMLTDLKTDKTKSKDEKLKFEKLYEQQLNIELTKQAEDRRKKEEENTKKANEAILQLRLALMPEGDAKEKALQDDKYRKLREAAIADTTLTEEKRTEILALYDEQRAKDDAAKELEK